MLEESHMPSEVRSLLPAAFELERPQQGETSDVTIVRTTEGHDLVVKRAYGPIYSQWLAREARVLRALTPTGLPVPEVRGEHAGHSSEGSEHWLVMTRIEGQNVWPVLLQAPPHERPELLRQLGALLARIHSTPIPSLFDDEDATPWLDRHRLCAAEFAFEDDTLLSSLATQPSGVRTLIHGDFTLDNVLIAGGELSGVIDWSGAGAGDPRFDITLALATTPELPLAAEDLTAFFDGYTGPGLPAGLRSMVEAAYGVR